ncbi:hypothetical protein ACTU6V_11095 [Microbacterium sp. A204]|uniref:hypothetical protein n=1 Tax=Microbacterium sp. A204 TaxID=3457321 RepID=UPI003FCFC3A6
MTILRTKTGRVRMLAVLAVAGAMLSACSPGPAPSPTPTAAFASEDEAFAAAEEVYRAYNDASNGDGKTTDYLTGSALESDIETKRYLDENNLALIGNSEIVSFLGVDARLDPITKIHAQVCLDVSGSRVIDANGNDVTPNDREDRWLLDITLSGTADTLTMSTSSVAEGSSC